MAVTVSNVLYTVGSGKADLGSRQELAWDDSSFCQIFFNKMLFIDSSFLGSGIFLLFSKEF